MSTEDTNSTQSANKYIIDAGLIKDVVKEKVIPQKLLAEAPSRYITLSAEVHGIKDSILNNEYPRTSVGELESLKSELESKFVIYKSFINHAKLMSDVLFNEIYSIEDFNSDQTYSTRKESIMKSQLLTKKRIDELTKKKKEIQDLNVIIESFKKPEFFSFTETELNESFGPENIEKIKSSDAVTRVIIRQKRKIVKEQSEDSKSETPEGKFDPSSDDFEEVEVNTYRFKADISKSVGRLKEIQNTLKSNLEQYERDIAEVKRGYIDKVAKFEAMMSLLKQGIVDEDGDVEIADADQEGGEQNRAEDDDQHSDENLTSHAQAEDDVAEDDVDDDELYNDE